MFCPRQWNENIVCVMQNAVMIDTTNKSVSRNVKYYHNPIQYCQEAFVQT